MKILLNLLPEDKKESVQRHLHYRFLLWQLFLLFTLTVFYFGILVSIYFILDFQLKGLRTVGMNHASSTSGEEERLNQYEKKFQEINELVEVVNRMEGSHLYFSNAFFLLDTILPDGVSIDHMTTNEYTISITGTADKREDLLLLDERLKQSKKCITAVNVPVSNLFSQKDIDFQIDFTVVPDCLKNSSIQK